MSNILALRLDQFSKSRIIDDLTASSGRTNSAVSDA